MKKMIRLSLPEQLYTQIREDIILHRIPGGAKLTMRELQDKYDVSSTPVREALTRLAQEGLVTTTTNQGAKVIDLDLKDMLEIHDLSVLLDSHALKLAMQLNRKPLISALAETLERQKTCMQQPSSIEEMLDSTNAFHKLFYEYASNQRLKSFSLQIRGLFAMVVLKTLSSTTLAYSIEEHQAILDAVCGGDDILAIQKLHHHFELGRERLVEFVSAEKTSASISL